MPSQEAEAEPAQLRPAPPPPWRQRPPPAAPIGARPRTAASATAASPIGASRPPPIGARSMAVSTAPPSALAVVLGSGEPMQTRFNWPLGVPRSQRAGAHVMPVALITFGRDSRDAEPLAIDAVLDVEHRLADPAARTSCCGYSGAILENISRNSNFPGILAEARSVIAHAVDRASATHRDPSPLRLGVRCRRGRHRSVGLALLLKHSLEGDNYRVSLRHVGLRLCGCPWRCRNVTSSSEQWDRWHRGIAALHHASNVWIGDLL